MVLWVAAIELNIYYIIEFYGCSQGPWVAAVAVVLNP